MSTFSVAFVCTGNRFRSPLAEAFVRRLTEGRPIETQSFGTLELASAPALPEALEIGLACGIPIADHRTRHLGVESLAKIDLVVGFEQVHVRQAVVDAGAQRDRSFTLRELIRLAHADDLADQDAVTRARHAVERAAQGRGEPALQAADEIRDPFGAPWKAYRDTATEIRQLSILLVGALFGIPAPTDLPEVPQKRARQRSLFRRA